MLPELSSHYSSVVAILTPVQRHNNTIGGFEVGAISAVVRVTICLFYNRDKLGRVDWFFVGVTAAGGSVARHQHQSGREYLT